MGTRDGRARCFCPLVGCYVISGVLTRGGLVVNRLTWDCLPLSNGGMDVRSWVNRSWVVMVLTINIRLDNWRNWYNRLMLRKIRRWLLCCRLVACVVWNWFAFIRNRQVSSLTPLMRNGRNAPFFMVPLLTRRYGYRLHSLKRRLLTRLTIRWKKKWLLRFLILLRNNWLRSGRKLRMGPLGWTPLIRQ